MEIKNLIYTCKRKRAKARIRLERMRAFNDIIERLGGHRAGKTFMVDTAGLKLDPPYLAVTERFSLLKLNYAHCVVTMVMYHRRKLEIVSLNDSLTYLIY